MMADVADLLLPVDELDLRCCYLADDEGGGLEAVFGSYYSDSDDEDDDGGPPRFDLDLCVPVLGRGGEFAADRLAISTDRRRPADDDPFLETLAPVPRGVSDDMEDAGADYLGPGIGLLLGPAFDDSDDEDVGAGGAGGGGLPPELGSRARLGVGGRDPSRSSLVVGDDMNPPALYWESTGELDLPEEWEEVDGRIVERDVFSLMVGGDGGSDGDYSDGETARNIEWEVLVAGNGIGRDPSFEAAAADDDLELYLADYHEDLVHTSEYEVLFGHFSEQDGGGGASRGNLPAAKSAVAGLPSITLTEEDVVRGDNICPVCKDEISLQEMAKQLPCLHHYHGECILPWLEIRNTCPVCRYPLPTGEPSRTAGNGRNAVESHGRYGFEILEVDDPRMIFY